jgi:hypothetical protein
MWITGTSSLSWSTPRASGRQPARVAPNAGQTLKSTADGSGIPDVLRDLGGRMDVRVRHLPRQIP